MFCSRLKSKSSVHNLYNTTLWYTAMWLTVVAHCALAIVEAPNPDLEPWWPREVSDGRVRCPRWLWNPCQQRTEAIEVVLILIYWLDSGLRIWTLGLRAYVGRAKRKTHHRKETAYVSSGEELLSLIEFT